MSECLAHLLKGRAHIKFSLKGDNTDEASGFYNQGFIDYNSMQFTKKGWIIGTVLIL